MPTDIKSLARSHSSVAISTLSGIAKKGRSEGARVTAAIALLDRGWGKPPQDSTHTLQGEVRVILRKMLTDEDEGGE